MIGLEYLVIPLIIIAIIISFIAGILCARFHKIVFWVKMFTFFILAGLSTILSIPHTLILFPLRCKLIYPLCWSCVHIGRLLGTTFELRGLENIKDNSSVLVFNHQFLMDLGVMASVRPKVGPSIFFALRSILLIPIYGVLSYFWGTIYINPSKPEKAKQILIDYAEVLKTTKMRILIYPEGKRNETDTFHPFKKGAFYLAINSQCPIQCVVSSRHLHFKYKDKIFDNGKIIVEILPEIPTINLTINDVNSLLEKVKNQMEMHVEKLTQEVISFTKKSHVIN